MSKIGKIVSISLFFSSGFIVGSIIFFPWDIVANYINSKSDMVYISSASFSPPVGVKFENVNLKIDNKVFKIDEIKIKPSLLSPIYIIFGRISVKIGLETQRSDADLELKMIKREKNKFIPYFIKLDGKVGIDDIMKIIQLEGKGELKINAEIKGEIDNPQKLNGKIRIQSSDGKGKNIVVLKNTEKIHIPVEGEFDLGKVDIYATIKEGIITFENVNLKEGNIEGVISGSIKLEKDLSNSQLNLDLDIKPKILNIPPQKLKIRGTISKPQVG
ncbi:MAG: type II secretion system protein GspN [Candidatus Calescibacterium sp.]|nr:type II secretion system protein GspN [Candidatus Calescibacterium sp.]